MIDPAPTNPTEMFIRLFLGLFFALTAIFGGGLLPDSGSTGDGQGGGEVRPTPPGTNAAQVLTTIDSVDALIMESFPAQIALNVSGAQPDGCEFPVIVEQTRDGNNVTVRIYRELPPDIMCAMILLPYNESIKLDGTFEPGTYQIDVNGTIIEVTV
ncbi:MAG: hypothetical protein K8L97_18035 [Anaerolineae bacterium]|nr:hypothetical protein [Anaerolineae bacterium]